MENKLNSGAIFKNTKTKETQPDYRGKVNVNGKDMEISLWVKESKTGTKYFSASFQEPYIKPVSQEAINQNNAQDLADNDLPF
jgi:uncharacterized protein (DUF736 family)